MADRELTPRELSDRVRIKDLLIRYSTAINDRDMDLLDTCFTPDAQCDYSDVGGPGEHYPALREWFEKTLGHTEASLHKISNIRYEFEGDVARTRSMYMNPILISLPNGESRGLTVGGFYQDEYICGSDGWRICKRVDVSTYHLGKIPTREEIEEILAS